jgi:hypothetical protein
MIKPVSRPQFTVRALLVAMLVVAAFVGGIHFERERRRREDDAIARQMEGLPLLSLPSQGEKRGRNSFLKRAASPCLIQRQRRKSNRVADCHTRVSHGGWEAH